MVEEQTFTRRWLLPITGSVDLSAMEGALRLADSGRAALIVVSLITAQSVTDIQKLSLDVFQRRAQELAISLEYYAEFTHDPLARIGALARELRCTALVLGRCGGQALFLTDDEQRMALACPPTSLVLLRLPSSPPVQMPGKQRARKRLRAPVFHKMARPADLPLTPDSSRQTEAPPREYIVAAEKRKFWFP